MKIVEKNSGGSTTSEKRFVWDGMSIAEERDGSNVLTKRFYGQGVMAGSDELYYTRGHLGSIRELTDDTGAIEARYDYDPYGRIAKVTGSGDADFRYTGHYYHSASGLNLAPYRAYDADLARWLSRDPIGENGGINLYGYAGSSPPNNIDSLGLSFGSWLMRKLGFDPNMRYSLSSIGAMNDKDSDALLGDLGMSKCDFVGNLFAMAGGSLADEAAMAVAFAVGGAIVGRALSITEDTIRVRHYTNSKGLKGIEESKVIKATDQNRVFAETAGRKPLGQIQAEARYGLKPGRGRNYVETDVPKSQVSQRYNPSTGANELVVKGNLPLLNPTFTRRP